MRVINIFLNEFVFFMNNQDIPKENNPINRNIFSLELKLLIFLKNK